MSSKSSNEEFFSSLDSNLDGTIEEFEIQQVVSEFGGGSLDEPEEIKRSVKNVFAQLDTNNDGTLTVAESHSFWRHLGDLLSVKEVVAWVVHGIQMPESIGEIFRLNSVSGYDFAELIEDDGAALVELGISKSVHRKKLVRSIKMLLSGVGVTPTQPQNPLVEGVSCQSAKVSWLPSDGGGFPIHKYRVLRHSINMISHHQIETPVASSSAPHRYKDNQDNIIKLEKGDWILVYDGPKTEFIDTGLISGLQYDYQIEAWSLFGHSSILTFNGSSLSTMSSKPCQQLQHEQEEHHQDEVFEEIEEEEVNKGLKSSNYQTPPPPPPLLWSSRDLWTRSHLSSSSSSSSSSSLLPYPHTYPHTQSQFALNMSDQNMTSNNSAYNIIKYFLYFIWYYITLIWSNLTLLFTTLSPIFGIMMALFRIIRRSSLPSSNIQETTYINDNQSSSSFRHHHDHIHKIEYFFSEITWRLLSVIGYILPGTFSTSSSHLIPQKKGLYQHCDFPPPPHLSIVGTSSLSNVHHHHLPKIQTNIDESKCYHCKKSFQSISLLNFKKMMKYRSKHTCSSCWTVFCNDCGVKNHSWLSTCPVAGGCLCKECAMMKQSSSSSLLIENNKTLPNDKTEIHDKHEDDSKKDIKKVEKEPSLFPSVPLLRTPPKLRNRSLSMFELSSSSSSTSSLSSTSSSLSSTTSTSSSFDDHSSRNRSNSHSSSFEQEVKQNTHQMTKNEKRKGKGILSQLPSRLSHRSVSDISSNKATHSRLSFRSSPPPIPPPPPPPPTTTHQI
jgi:hypothetical protein